jgi:hypothetical protein
VRKLETYRASMMLLVLMHLTLAMWTMNQISLFQERLSGHKNSLWIS